MLSREHRPDWVFFDSLVRFHSRRENDSAQMSDWLQRKLKPLLRRSGAGAVILHHLRKMGGKDQDNSFRSRLRGASDFRAWLDQLWGVEEDHKAGTRRIVHDKNRWTGESLPLRLDIEDVTGDGVRIVSSGRADDVEEALIHALEQNRNQGLSRQDLIRVAEAEGVKDPARTASRWLKKFVEEGDVIKARRGREAIYRLRSDWEFENPSLWQGQNHEGGPFA